MRKIRLLVVDDVPQTRKDIIRLLYFEDDMEVVGEAGNGVEALQKIAEVSPDVVLMDINMPQMDGITATERICNHFPSVAVIIISIQGESEYLKKAMFAGARDYLVKPLGSEEMAAAIRSVYKQLLLRGTQPSYQLPPTGSHLQADAVRMHAAPSGQNPAFPPQFPAALAQQAGMPPAQGLREIPLPSPVVEEKLPGLVTTIFSGKGGVGKTTIATNLAVVLAQQEKKKVVLVDLDLQFGDISVMLNLTDGYNISDLVREEKKLDEAMLSSHMIRHFTGIDILPAPMFPQDAEYVTTSHVEAILNLLKQGYDHIIVDTAATFHDINLQALDQTDQILLVATRDISTIKNARTALSVLDSLGYRDKIRLVLNRCDQDLGVEVDDLEKGVELTVAYQIPGDERSVVSAINKGVPVVISHAGAEISRSFRRMGEKISGGKHQPMRDKPGKQLINRIFSL